MKFHLYPTTKPKPQPQLLDYKYNKLKSILAQQGKTIQST